MEMLTYYRNTLTVTLLYLGVLLNEIEMKMYNQKTAIIDLVTENGYPIENHTVTTEDGYVLGLQRIPHGLKNTVKKGKPAVLLMHGLLGSAETWVLLGSKRSLGFILADEGYDVWLGNARGTTHSRGHATLNPSDWEYWQFSWHEIGMYDLPAYIKYILDNTGQKKIGYVGHSQGTTSFFVMASERPELNKNIQLMVALAPPVFVSDVPDRVARLLSNIEKILDGFLSLIPAFEIFPNDELSAFLRKSFCVEGTILQELCVELLTIATGGDARHINRAIYSPLLSTMPAGCSTRQILHYSQLANSDSFWYYNYGPAINAVKYNSTISPKYNLKRVSTPIATFYSKDDPLVPFKGVQKLNRMLPNLIYTNYINNRSFNHMDFVAGIDNLFVYEIIVDLFRHY